MSCGIICRQTPKCDEYAAYRYTWAGQDESFACESHAARLQKVASVMGYYVQLIPLLPSDHAGPEGMKSLETQRGEMWALK